MNTCLAAMAAYEDVIHATSIKSQARDPRSNARGTCNDTGRRSELVWEAAQVAKMLPRGRNGPV
jgi:hypothetical protein